MALVIRSEREFDFIPKIKNNLGPGEYENFFKKIQNYQLKNIIPFNSKKERDNQNFIISNNELGPGEYFKENPNSFLKKSFSNNNIEDIKEMKLYNISLFHLINKAKYQKLKDIKTLIIDKTNSNQIKNSKKIIKSKTNKIYPKKYIKLMPTTLTKNRISSIPSKPYFLGYNYDKNGIPLMIEENVDNIEENQDKKNNKKDIIKRQNNSLDLSKMSKNDIASFTNYLKKDQIKKEKIKKNSFNITKTNNNVNNTNYSTNYDFLGSNCSTNNSTNLQFNKQTTLTDISSRVLLTNKHINSIDSYNSNKSIIIINNSKDNKSSFINNKSFSPKTISNKIKGNLYKLISKNLTKNNKLEKNKIETNNINNLSDSDIEAIVYKTLLEIEPGPGYYSNKSIFDKYQLLSKNKKKYNFGSNAERTLNLLDKNTNKNIGPGYYTKIETDKKYNKTTLSPFSKLKKLNPKKNIKKILDSPKISEDFFPKPETSSNIGPGKYEYYSQFNKTQKYRTGPLEQRFFNINKEIKPGPGEYLPLDDWKKINKIKIKKTKIQTNKKINSEIKNEIGRDYFIPKNDNPEVGAYNPQIFNSIEYKNICNSNKITSLYAPFNSSEDKNLQKHYSTPEKVGPGSYIINNNNSGFKINRINDMKIKYNKILKDIEKTEKIKDLYHFRKQKMKNKIGPGTYDNYKYDNWNKRSFNILYI